MQRSRAWTFTVNNYSDDDEKLLQDLDERYIVYGHEVGESGTPHLQGYIVFNNQKKFSEAKNYLPKGCHIESAKGNADQNFTYCTKDDKDFFEHGDRPKAGKRKDLETIYTLAKEQKSDIDIGETCPATYMKFYKAVDRVRLNYARTKKRVDAVDVIELDHDFETLVHTAYKIDPDLYWFQGTWWDGYQGQSTILITDNDHYKLAYEQPFNFQLPIKGGFTWKNWDRIICRPQKRYAT